MNDSRRPGNGRDFTNHDSAGAGSADFDENDVIVVEEDWDDDEWETGGDDGLPAPSWSDGASDGSGAERDRDGVRLQKVMASSGVASRRASEELIEAGRVRVNGEVVRELGRRINPEIDKIAVDNVAVQLDTSRRYVMLNKPVGVVSSLSDENGRPDLRQFTELFEERLFNVGRLDAETSGLLILTNDGELAHVLAHPSFGVMKTYIAKVRGKVTAHTIATLTSGIDLEDGHIAADKARLLESATNSMYSLVEITLHSGRNRIVRRMLDAVGHPVVDLVRRSFGPLTLGSLAVGGVRELSRDELGALLTLSREDSGLNKPARAPRPKKSAAADGAAVQGKNVPGRPKAFKANGKPAGKALGKDAGKPRWATAARSEDGDARANGDQAQSRELNAEDAAIAAAAAERRASRPATNDRKAPTKYAGKPATARPAKSGSGSSRAGTSGADHGRPARPERTERSERTGSDRDRSTGRGGYESRGRGGGYESRGGSSGGYNRSGGAGRDGGYESRGRDGGYESRGGSSGGYNRSGGAGRDGGYESRGRDGGYESRGGNSGGYNRSGGSSDRGAGRGGYESRGGSSGGYNRTGGSDRDGGRSGGYGNSGDRSQGRGGYGGATDDRGGYQGRGGNQGRDSGRDAGRDAGRASGRDSGRGGNGYGNSGGSEGRRGRTDGWHGSSGHGGSHGSSGKRNGR